MSKPFTLVRHHVVQCDGQMVPVSFPHLCPGDACAVARYLQQRSVLTYWEIVDFSRGATWPELVARLLKTNA